MKYMATCVVCLMMRQYRYGPRPRMEKTGSNLMETTYPSYVAIFFQCHLLPLARRTRALAPYTIVQLLLLYRPAAVQIM